MCCRVSLVSSFAPAWPYVRLQYRSYRNPGASWRVGVSAIRDAVAQLALGDLGRELLSLRTVAAVMTVTPHLNDPTIDGAREIIETEMHYQVELWRSELLCGVLEVDTTGNVVPCAFVKDQPAYSAHRVLGLPPGLIEGEPLSALLGVNNGYQQTVDMLMKEGGFNTQRSGLQGRSKGGLRISTRQKREVGPVHTLRLTHPSDGDELEIQVRARSMHAL